jgi:hypothetical protein
MSDAEYATSVPGATHVLAWLPAGLTEDGSGWELLTATDFSVSWAGHWAAVVFDAPEDADPGYLAASVAEELAQPVTLTADTRDIKLSPRRLRWYRQPIYWVIPAGGC